jgi:hypothetical protein
MKKYANPTIEIQKFDSGEDVMKVSSLNINNEKIIKGTDINNLSQWHS